MNWKIEVKPSAEKQYLKLDSIQRKRIKKNLLELEKNPTPLRASNVKALTGNLAGDFRIRIGDLRLLFTPDCKKKILHIYAILPRGDAY